MIIEEVIPNRIRDLLAACTSQHDMIYRLIVEVDPAFHPDHLKLLLHSRRWPHAVNPNLIVDPNSFLEQNTRAHAILDQLLPPMSGKKILDFGCGNGHLTRVLRSKENNAIGYDIDRSQFAFTEPWLTDDWESVKSQAPYDAAVIYDVLDHSKDEHPIDCLTRIRSVLSPDATVYVRCHPWCSRTGTHAYTTLNKAYVHYFFSEDQLEEMGANGIWTRKITHPIITYDDWALKSGFKKISEDVKREAVEPFWQEEPYIRTLTQEHWKHSFEESLANGTKFPRYQMEIQWVDFRLMPHS